LKLVVHEKVICPARCALPRETALGTEKLVHLLQRGVSVACPKQAAVVVLHRHPGAWSKRQWLPLATTVVAGAAVAAAEIVYVAASGSAAAATPRRVAPEVSVEVIPFENLYATGSTATVGEDDVAVAVVAVVAVAVAVAIAVAVAVAAAAVAVAAVAAVAAVVGAAVAVAAVAAAASDEGPTAVPSALVSRAVLPDTWAAIAHRSLGLGPLPCF